MKAIVPKLLGLLKALCLLLCSICIQTTTFSQSLDSKGNDFWLAFPGNLGADEYKLFISAEQNTTGTVSVPGVAFSVPFSVTVGTITTVDLPASVSLENSNVIGNLGIHVVALQEVTIYALSRRQATTDAYLALPTDILGTEYIALGYKNSNIINGTQFALVAAQNATTVTITPTVTTDGRLAGVAYSILLNQGQTYQLRNTGGAPNDLSGSIISSNKPIAVFGSHQCANIPPGFTFCDFVVEQLPPTTAWGKNFVSVPLKTRINGDTFRFLASENNTLVSVNGSLVVTLNRGQLFETILTTASQITSTKPILVAQYSNSTSFDGVTSDPFMMLITPFEQFLGNYTFATPASGFRLNFVNVVAPPGAVGALKLDGVTIPSAAFSAIGTSGFLGAQLDLTAGTHTINGTNLPFGIFVYGFDDADSYGYPGGQSLAPIATVSTISSITAPPSGTSPIGISNCFSVTVRDQFNSPVSGVRVDFGITGTNTGSSGFAFTNASGVATFCYSGPAVGTDNIIASVGTITSPPASFIWTPVVVANDFYSKATGDLHNVISWGVNLDGSGANPPNFGAGKTYHLANRVPDYSLTFNWTVSGIVDLPAGSILHLSGFTLSISQLIGTGMIDGTPTSGLMVTGNTGGDAGTLRFVMGGRMLSILMVNRSGAGASATIGTPLAIFDVLNIVSGTLNTGNELTLKSSAAATARVAPVTGNVMGDVIVERYIPARRAWRIMSAPVGGNQSINSAWQEGATTSSANTNPSPGFGTHITQGSAANGFDFNPQSGMNSILRYNSMTNNWMALPNTNATNINANAYMTFVRGNRGVTLGFNNVPANNTVLRSKGPLKTGDQIFAVSATGFTGIPNPFASPINYATITRTNVPNNFYLWDPKLGGVSGVGGYVLLSFNGVGYTVTPTPVSPESELIQSGQGFLVQSTGAAGSITIKESDKSATAATNVFRSANKVSGLKMTLMVDEKGDNKAVVDEALTSFGLNYSNNLDAYDPEKLSNINENLGMTRNGKTLMVERRQPVNGTDTIFLKLWNMEQRKYSIAFTPENLSAANIQSAVLVDNLLKTRTPLDLTNSTNIELALGANAASDASRFMVVLYAGRNSVLESITEKGGTFKILSNPVKGNTIRVMFMNQPKGIYTINVVNIAGQRIYNKQFTYDGGTATLPINIGTYGGTNTYQLQIANPAGNVRSVFTILTNNN